MRILLSAFGSMGLVACGVGHPVTPAPVAIPPADAALITAIHADSLLFRMDEPGYALVYMVGQGGYWLRISPASTRSVRLPAGPAAVALPQPSESPSARLAGTRSEAWPSETACAAAKYQVCNKDNRSDWVVNTSDGVPPNRSYGIESVASYLVIITPTLPNLDQAHPDSPVSLKPAEVVQSLVRRVSTLAPVRRWAVVAAR